MTTIARTVGSVFAASLTTAGLGGLPISWDSLNVYYDENILTSAQISSLEAVIAADNPNAISPATAYASAIATGFNTGLGFNLSMDQAMQNNIGNACALLNLALTAATSNGTQAAVYASNESIIDSTGQSHTLTVSALIPVLIAYGNACKTLQTQYGISFQS